MINKEKVIEEIEKTVSITCDICNKIYIDSIENNDILEIQEFTHINFTGGYGSIFGDGDEIKLDICQHCLKEKLGQYIK